MLARFFIDRPVLSVVISIVIVLAGLAAGFILPMDQYPQITPPTVEVSCVYPGASAQVVQDTVAVPLEQETHGGEDVAVYARGPWAHRFRGNMEQHWIFHLMQRAFGF